MNQRPANRTLSTPAGTITLRPEAPADSPFLFVLYCGTREDEMNLTNWDAPTRHAFLTMQFNAMRSSYASMFPRGRFAIIELEGRPIGRQVVNEEERCFCVVDVALRADFQNRGIGSVLMRDVMEQAQLARKPVRLHVIVHNRAIHFYQRLGFHPIGEAAMHQEMEWKPAD